MDQIIIKKMNKLEVFIARMKRLGIKVNVMGNAPWIYIDEINGKRVTEKFEAEHGFTVAWYPVRLGAEIEFTDIREIFKLIRKYA